MATLVTGSTGFAGSNIVRALAEHGHEVVAFDLAGPDDLVNKYVAPWTDQITFVQGSVLDMDALEGVFASFSINKVIHAAAYTPHYDGTGERLESRRIIQTNIMSTVNVLDMARATGVERFLYVSSGGVYGGSSTTGPADENALVSPTILYSISKFTCERIVDRYHEIHDMDTVSVRLGALYGPMERVTDYRANMSLLYHWTGKALRGEPIEVHDTFAADTYVMDMANGLCAVLDAADLPHRLYNLSSNTSTPISKVVAALLEAYPGAKFIGPIPKDPESPSSFGIDVSRIKKDLGFEAAMDPTEGLKAYIQWRTENGFMD